MKIKSTTTAKPKTGTASKPKSAPKRRKKGKLEKQLAKMNGTSKLEDTFREILDQLGEPYLQHYRFGNREFDFCMTEKNILIEIHGCFFHACPTCGKEAKLAVQKRSVRNDRHKVKLVKESRDYTLLTFWEHEIHKERAEVIMRLIEALG